MGLTMYLMCLMSVSEKIQGKDYFVKIDDYMDIKKAMEDFMNKVLENW